MTIKQFILLKSITGLPPFQVNKFDYTPIPKKILEKAVKLVLASCK